MLQILAASTLPALGKFSGINLPASANSDALAYIGLIAVSYIAIRLLWAPYAIWKSDKADIGELKLELTRPERLVLEHLAKLRAKARNKLAKQLYQMHLVVFSKDEDALDQLAKHYILVYQLAHEAGLPQHFHEQLKIFDELCELRLVGKISEREDFNALDALQRSLTGEITIESLALRLPQGTEQEIQQ